MSNSSKSKIPLAVVSLKRNERYADYALGNACVICLEAHVKSIQVVMGRQSG